MGLYLITGGQGFIGKHLTNELIGAGHSVRIIDSLVEQAHGGKPLPARNGAGKTNLLEALYFACTGRSCRTANECANVAGTAPTPAFVTV